MSGLPTITMNGTLTGDPEIRMLPSGVAVVSVNIAANERKFNKETKQYEQGDTTYLRGSLWRQYAENVAESLHKGDRVIVTGTLKQRSYEKGGQTRSTVELEIDEIGPSLRFATAVVNRGGATASSGNWGGGATTEPAW